ncbi:MAG: response regulator [Acidobacteriota bacterium]|nr:response regulator [Acidobacteriota bacterium]
MNKNPAPPSRPRSALRARLRIYSAVGLAILGAWLYYTVNTVLGLYDVTLAIEQSTDLRQRVLDAQGALKDSEESLERYISGGQGYDLSRHHVARISMRTALGSIRRRATTVGSRGSLERAESAEEIYSRAADRAIAAWNPDQPAAARQIHDDVARPAADKLKEFLSELEGRFSRSEAFAEERLKDSRDFAARAIGVLAILIIVGIFWILSDVGRRIVVPLGAGSRALEDLASGRTPPRLLEQWDGEAGELGRQFNRVADLFASRARALEERDIEASVNAILTVAATVNDLSGFGTATMEKILEVTGAASGVLYLPKTDSAFEAVVSLGGSEGDSAVGREEAARAARERRPAYLSVEAKTPTVNVLDGRVLPRETAHIPLVYFDHVVGVLALGATTAFTARTRNALSAIAPSLAVALANAAANERVAEQSRRLAEQNELLEEQRSRIGRTAAELQRAGELKDRFLASVSHELRTPMTVILGFTGTLLRENQGPLNAAQRDSLERVQRNAKLLLGLINDILDISKIESGKAEVDSQPISIAPFLSQVEADYQDAARRKGLRLTAAAAPGLTRVTSDPAKLTQILSNLIGNALKFTEKGSISVRAEERTGGRWALIVADTGIGIPEDEQGAIFEEFRQGEGAEHRGRGGTGLGLAIVKKLAKFLGGTVSLESEPGRGSRFTVTLPLLAAPLPAPAAAPVFERDGAGIRTVLIVDDDEGVRRLLALELEPYGLRVLEAGDGAEGVRLARVERPDVVLLDVLMPRMSGWDALRELKESPETRGIPVIVLSAVENRAFGLALGAFDYLVKPLGRPDLLSALGRAGVLASRGHVLVVDDDADVRAVLEQELVAAGFRPKGVGGGAEALEELERERPAAVLLDLMMPPPDGFEVLYRIRENPKWKDLPVVIVTSKELTPDDYARLSGSAQRVLRKGKDLQSLVREVLATIEETRAASAATATA